MAKSNGATTSKRKSLKSVRLKTAPSVCLPCLLTAQLVMCRCRFACCSVMTQVPMSALHIYSDEDGRIAQAFHYNTQTDCILKLLLIILAFTHSSVELVSVSLSLYISLHLSLSLSLAGSLSLFIYIWLVLSLSLSLYLPLNRESLRN